MVVATLFVVTYDGAFVAELSARLTMFCNLIPVWGAVFVSAARLVTAVMPTNNDRSSIFISPSQTPEHAKSCGTG